MCNGLTKSGKQCSRKAEWCAQHKDQKPAETPVVVAEPVAEQKKEELIVGEVEIVAEDIASPMSPNSTTTATTIATPIVKETKAAPIKKLFNDYECIFNHKGAEAHYWVEKCAIGRAAVFPILKNPNGKYWWDTKGYRVINVIHHQGKYKTRRYAYFENMVDMFAFIKYFHGKASSMGAGTFECHEVFIGQDPRIKMFFDIESVIPVEAYESMLKWMNGDDSDMAAMVSEDVVNAMKLALEEVDTHYEIYESLIDYAIVSRSRKVADGMKISYHVITNVSLRVSECKALVKVIKDNYLSCINVERPEGYMDMLCAKTTLDINPYRKNGSLSLPGSSKDGHTLVVVKPFKNSSTNLHLLDTNGCDDTHDFTDDLPIKVNITDREAFEESSSEFIKKALAKLNSERVPAYDPASMDLYANTPRGNYLRVARTAPSHCPACDRTHDNADTLLLIFNESKEIALWKCAHNEDMRAKRWFGKSGSKEYELDAHDEDEIEAFAKTLTTRAQKVAEVKVEKKKDADERMSNNEAIRQLPTWDITIDKDIIPPIHDTHNPCCYADYLTLGQNPISGKEAMKYISNNFALILSGGNSFFITKNFSYRLNGNRETCEISYQYLKYKSIANTPGNLQIKLTNPETKKDEIHSFPIWRLLMVWQSHIAYSEIRFSPYGAKIGYDWSNNKVFNTFTGFVNNYDPDFVIDESKFARFFEHIREAWCDDDIALFEFTVKLLAYMVQFPHLKTAVAMIVMGPEGLGKNFVMELWRDHVIGDTYFVETPRIEAITGKFNTQLETSLMVVLNEAAKVNRSIDSNKDQEVVKDLITEMRRRYERKGHDAHMGDCYNNVIMFSNNDYVVRASTEMRRFVFYRGSGRFIGKEMEHFAPIKKDFVEDNAGIHLYHYLMNIDLTGFHPQRSAPSTKAKEELKLTAIEKPIQWLIASLNDETRHTFANTNADHDEKNFYITESILGTYNAWLESCGEKPDATLKKLSKTLNRCFGENFSRKRIGGIKVRGYELSINEMKELLAKTTRRNDLFDDDDE